MSTYDDLDGLDIDRQEADYELAELNRLGALTSSLQKRGICVHGWTQGATPEHRPDLMPDKVECLRCHKIATQKELDSDYRRYLA